MIWTITGAGLVAYECWAIARGHATVSRLSHRAPYALVVWGWWVGLGLHLIREWRRERT